MKSHLVAKRYAQAFFELAKAEGAVGVEAELAALSALFEGSDAFLAMVKTPVVTIDEKMKVIDILKEKAGISPLLYAFLTVLVKKNRIDILAAVAHEVEALFMADRGEVEAEVTFAAAPADSVRKELVSILENVTGKKVTLSEKVDANILGGVRAKIGSQLYDASVRGQLDKIRDSLAG